MSDHERIIIAKKTMSAWKGGPFKYPDGTIVYTDKHHRLHRIDGPAIISERGNKWYVKNIKITSWRQLQREANLSDEELLKVALTYGEIDK